MSEENWTSDSDAREFFEGANRVTIVAERAKTLPPKKQGLFLAEIGVTTQSEIDAARGDQVAIENHFKEWLANEEHTLGDFFAIAKEVKLRAIVNALDLEAAYKDWLNTPQDNAVVKQQPSAGSQKSNKRAQRPQAANPLDDVQIITANSFNQKRAELDQLVQSTDRRLRDEHGAQVSLPKPMTVDRWDQVRPSVISAKKRVVQFVCHGQPSQDDNNDGTQLHFSDTDDKHPTAANVAAALVNRKHKVECALLLVCFTGQAFAKELAAKVPFLVVADGKIEVEYARHFLAEFYAALHNGASLAECLADAKDSLLAVPGYSEGEDYVRLYIDGRETSVDEIGDNASS